MTIKVDMDIHRAMMRYLRVMELILVNSVGILKATSANFHQYQVNNSFIT